MKVWVKLWYPDQIDRPPVVVGVYKKQPSTATTETAEEFELQD